MSLWRSPMVRYTNARSIPHHGNSECVPDMPKGDNARKLTDADRSYIKGRVALGICQAALARKFCVSRQRINQIVREECTTSTTAHK